MDGTRRSARRAAMVAALVVGAVLALASCAPAAVQEVADAEPTSTPDETTKPSPAPTEDNGTGADNGNGSDSDGPQDPAQQTRRSGPAAEYGGPPYGDQGVDVVGDGRWCAAVGFFWGGDGPPQNVTFTIDGIVSHPASALTAQPGGCNGAASCLGFVMTPETPFTVCGLLLAAGPSFTGEAEARFVGTLVCTQARYCDAAIARPAQPGPPIVVRASDPQEGGGGESPEPEPLETGSPDDGSPGNESPESEAP